MALIDDLISELPAGDERTQIIEELARFRKRIGFGVKWEEHDEYIPLWGLPIEANSMVVKWNLPYVIAPPRAGGNQGGVTREQAYREGFQGYIVESSVQLDELNLVQLQQVLQDDNAEHPEAEDEEALRVQIEAYGGCTTIRHHRGGEVEHVLTRTLVRIAKGQEEIIPLLRYLQTIVHPNAEEVSTTHAVIESENIVALHILRSTHRRSFDLIYLDPPYNAQQRDWKYNNDYVDPEDGYKHSKWMAFIHHRLEIAKELLAEDGVVVVAIDENEHANLVLLLQKMWPDRAVVSVAIQHNTKGIRGDDFRMNNDFAVFVYCPIRGGRMSPKQRKEIDDRGFMKYNLGDNQPNQVYPSLYPFIINPENGEIIDIGDTPDAIPAERNVVRVDGNIEVWPFDSDGCTRTWSNGRATAIQRVNEGIIYARNTRNHWDIRKITSENPYFSLWAEKKYDNQIQGTNLLKKVFETSPFPYPKSIATMIDVILATTRDRPEAKILDFFGGSGTTLHATMVVNEMYGGQRQCILVSAAEVNGEISIDDGEGEMRTVEHWGHLASQGHTPTDDEWLQAGVIRSATLPRLDYFVRGVSHDGTDIIGDYLSGYNYNVNRVIEFLRIPQDTSPILVRELTQESIGHARPFYVSRTKPIAALWDADNAESSDAFIHAIGNLPQNTKLELVFIRTDDEGLFANLQTQIQDALVNIPEVQENTRAMSLGFPNQAIECFQLIYGNRINLLYNDDFTSMREISWLYAHSTQRYQNPPEDYAIATEDGEMIGSADGAIIHHGFERQYESALASSNRGRHVISLPHTLLEYANHARILPNQKIGGEEE